MFAAEAEHVRVESGENGDGRIRLGHHERRELALFKFAMLRWSARCHVNFQGIKDRRETYESRVLRGRDGRQLCLAKESFSQADFAELT